MLENMRIFLINGQSIEKKNLVKYSRLNWNNEIMITAFDRLLNKYKIV